MQIKILGAHNTGSKNSRLSGVLIDGVIALDAGSLATTLSFEEQLSLQAVLVTHQHYDHVRDLPALGMTLYLNQASLDVYCLPETIKVLSSCLFGGDIYPDFTRRPENKPTFNLLPVKTGNCFEFSGYQATAIAVPHSVPAVGYYIACQEGASVFYTGDAGAGFSAAVNSMNPQLIIVEVTAPNRFTEFGKASGHLTPVLLEEELTAWKQASGKVPRIVVVHMYASFESEIEDELSQVADNVEADIILAHEDMTLFL